MARPSAPLIVRERALQHALDLVDELGYDGFSLPRLAQLLGVQPPSLYHHFASRAELLAEATRTVIDSVQLPSFEDRTPPWREWCLEVALAMRDMILARPGVAPMVTWYLSTIGVPELHQQCVEYLWGRGLTDEQSTLVVDALERLTLGSATVEAVRNRPQNPRYAGDPGLELEDDASARQSFASTVRTFLAGVPDVTTVEEPGRPD